MGEGTWLVPHASRREHLRAGRRALIVSALLLIAGIGLAFIVPWLAVLTGIAAGALVTGLARLRAARRKGDDDTTSSPQEP